MAQQEFRHDVTVRSITRTGTSANGNPSFRIVTDEGEFRTQTDASLGYGITNYTNANFPETYVIGVRVTLITTRGGLVWAIEKNGQRLA